MTKPRITCVLTKGENGEPASVYLYINLEGRDLLASELLRLNERWDHLHIQPEEWTVELPLQIKPYVPDAETVIQDVKIMYRPDAWDEQYFPHVMKDGEPSA